MVSEKSVVELIAELNQTDETDALEAKKAAEVGRSLLETVCSLSNEPGLGGGTILLGVEKEELSLFPDFVASGVELIDKVVTDLSSQLATIFNMPIRCVIGQEMVNGKCVIKVDVAELPPAQKPLYFIAQGLPKGAYRRIGSSDIRCNRDDLSFLFQTNSQEAPDSYVVNGATWDDIDVDAVSAYRNARSRLNPLAEELNWSDEDLLFSLHCLSREGKTLHITRAGLVNFGKAPSIRRLYPSDRVDYIRLSGKEWVSDTDSGFDATEIRGPSLKIIGRIISAILDDVPKAFRIKDGNPQRTDTPLIPERVIREAVVNAIAHRNYRVHAPIQILRYSNRIEIRNPGYSLKSQERFDEPGSAQRNPNIAEVLHETRFAETKGSGIKVMRQKMTEMGLTEPTFISSREDDKFSAIFLFHHFLSEQDWAWLSAFQEFGLDNEQMRALIFLREMGAVDNSCYRHLNQVDTLSASVSLRRLKEIGLLEAKGSGSRTHYVGTQLFGEVSLRSASPPTSDSMHAAVASMHAKDAGMHATQISDTMPPSLAAKLKQARKRMMPETAEKIIIEICTVRPASADEIASLMGRGRNYVANKYLYRMVREGILNYAIPSMVKHPEQKFVIPPKKGPSDGT